MKNKKIIATVLAGSLALTACACNVVRDETSDTEASVSATETTTAATTTTTAAPETSATEETSESSDVSESVESGVTRGADEPETSETTESLTYEQIYTPILNAAYAVLTGAPGDDIPEGFTGIMEYYQYSSQSDPIKDVGYKIADITSDGVPELIIGLKYDIFAVYTIEDDRATLVIEGWGRSSEQMLNDGSFYNSGSGGASVHIFGRYTLSPDGTTKNWSDCYFTDLKDEQTWEVGIYHNKTGSMDKSVSEELPISMEDLESIEKGYMDKVTELNLQPITFAVTR
ncbi:MAG: hypothetical protein J6X33_02580 [Clostridiales bacterium]|nr:hypothetical protein [Clostridiales bacterium]